MATSTAAKSRSRGGSSKKAQTPTQVGQISSTTTENAYDPKAQFVVKDIDPHTIVVVRNGFQGKLIYRSKKTGERFEWSGFGEPQDMEISELRNARNTSKKYFENNWFMFDDPWVVDYLGMSRFYKHAVSISDFDEIFTKTPDEARDVIKNMSDGQKKSVAYRARQLISSGDIDSYKLVATLEECLGVALVEHAL